MTGQLTGTMPSQQMSPMMITMVAVITRYSPVGGWGDKTHTNKP